MKRKLYIDFDGVILNTIERGYDKIRKMGLEVDADSCRDFYCNIDWNQFIEECQPIRDSITYLKKLLLSNLYDVSILTHVHSEVEAVVKKNYLFSKLGVIDFIPVLYGTPKWKAVDCREAILVDDYSHNLELWKEHGGISIKFSIKDKTYDFIKIDNLGELIDKYSTLEQLFVKTEIL